MASSQDNQDGPDMSEHSLDMDFLMDGGTEAAPSDPPNRSVSPPKTRKAKTPLTHRGKSKSNAEDSTGSNKRSLSPTRRTPRRVHSMNRTKREAQASPANNQSRTNVLRLPSKSDRRGKMRMASGFSSERHLMRNSIEDSIKNLLDEGSLEDFSAKDGSKRTSDVTSTDNEQSPPSRPGLNRGDARPSMEKRRSISCSRLSLALEVESIESDQDKLTATKQLLKTTAAPASIPRRKNSNRNELKRNKTLPEGADKLDSDVKAKTMRNHFAIPSRRRKTPMRSSSFSPESGALRAFGIRQESDSQQPSRSSDLPSRRNQRSNFRRSSSFSSRGNREMFNKVEEMKKADQRQRANDNDTAVTESTKSTRSSSPTPPKKYKSKLKKLGGAALPSPKAYKKLGSKLTEKFNNSMAGFGNSMSNMFVSPEDFDQLPLEGDEIKEGASGDVPTPMITRKKSSGSKRNKKKGDFNNSMAGFGNSVSGMFVSSIGPEDFVQLPLEGDEIKEGTSGDVPTSMITKKKSSGSKRNKKGGRYRDVSPATMGRLSASFSQFEAMKKSLPPPELTTKDKKATRKKAKRSKTMSDEKKGKPMKKKSSLRRTKSTSSGGSGISEENRFRRKKSNSSAASADGENKISRIPSRIKIRRSKTLDFEDPTTKGTAETATTAQQQTNSLHVRGNLHRANSDLTNYFRGSAPSLTRGRESEKSKKKKKSKKKRDKSKDPMYFERNVGKYASRRPPSKSVERMKVEATAQMDTQEPESLTIEQQKATSETGTGPVEVTIEAMIAEDMLAAPTGSDDNILLLEAEILQTTSGDNGATGKTGIPEWGSKSMVEIFDEHAKKKSSDLMKALLASQGNFLDTDMPDMPPMPLSKERTPAPVQPSTVTTMEVPLEQRKTELKAIVAESKRRGVKPPLAILKEALELGVIDMPPGTLEKMNLAMARTQSSKKTPPVSPQFSQGAPPTIVQGRVLKNLMVTKKSTEPTLGTSTRNISGSEESASMPISRGMDEDSDKQESHDETATIGETRLPGGPMGQVAEVVADAPQISAPRESMDTDISKETLVSRANAVEATEVMVEVDALLENTELPMVEDVAMESNILEDAEAAMHKAMAAMEEAKAAMERIDDVIEDTGGTAMSTDSGSPAVVPEEADAGASAVSDEPSIARIQMELHGSPASRSESSRQLWEEVKAGQSHMPMPKQEPTIHEEIPELDTTVDQILNKIARQTKDQKDEQVSLDGTTGTVSSSKQTSTKDVEEPVLDLTSKMNTKNKEGDEKQAEAGKGRSAKRGGSKLGKPEFDWTKKAVSDPTTAAGGQTEPMDLITSGAETTHDIEKKAKELGEPGVDWTSKAKADQIDINKPNGSKGEIKAEPEERSLADSQTGLMALIASGAETTTDEDEESMSEGSDSDSDDSDSSNENRFGMSMPNLNLSSSKNSAKKPVAQKKYSFMDSDDSESDSEGTSDSDDDDSPEGGKKQKDSAMAMNPDGTSMLSNNSLNMADLGQDDSIVTPSHDSGSTMQTEDGFQSMPDLGGDKMGALPVFQRKAPRMSIVARPLSETCSALDLVQFTPRNFVSQREDHFDDHYELGQLLGEGEFGEVFVGYQKQGKGGHGEERAIKIIDKNRMCKGDYEQVINEFNLLKGLTHPNLLTLYGFYEDDGNCYIVTDICKGGELWDELDARGKFDEADTAIFITNLMSAVKFLQSHKIVHRDINLENILLEESKELDQMKIIDFGLATLYEDGVKLSDLVGKVHYVAPQVLEQSYEGSKYDVWSVGVVSYILLSGFAPFEGDTDALVMEQVMIGDVDFTDPAWEGISDEAKDFVRHVLEFEEDSRPTAEQALKHAWIQNSIKANTASFMHDYKESSVTCFENIFDFASDASLKLKEAVYTYIASQLLRKQEREEIDRVFRGMDEDCDGKLSKSDITKGYKRFFDKRLSKKETEKLFERINTSGTGYIDYTEFVIAAMQKSKILDEEKLRAAFSSFDRGDKGFISANDLKVALSGAVALPMNGSMSADQLIEEMMKEVDVEGDGKISYQNFADMMLHKTVVTGTPMYISDDDEEEDKEEKHTEMSNSDDGPAKERALSMDWATASFLGHESDELSRSSLHDREEGTSFHPNVEAIMEDEPDRTN